MKLDYIEITDPDIKKSVEAKINAEWENGNLNDFKKKYPNAKVVVSLPNKDVSPANKKIDYWCDVFNENGDLIKRFCIIGNRVILSNVVIKKTT